MIRSGRILAVALVILAAVITSACEEGGIGMGVPASGARWGGGNTGPGVFVAGGPSY
jgi:hypothetical protein